MSGLPVAVSEEEIEEMFIFADKDGDGKLSDEERAAAHKAMQERREKCLKEFDADGDGTLNEDERAAAREARGKRCRAGAGPRQD